ncbi:MAG TPA: hypothetical protein PLJ67_08820 [Giesbergeria sp.]|nr:hypothetical protein [Giesbergeria sp.]
MPSSIPVRVADRDFPSINQARLHYTDILHRVPTGQKLEEADNRAVLILIQASGLHLNPEARAFEVAQGSFGRKCLVARPCKGDTQTLSILRAVKGCALKPQGETAEEEEAVEGASKPIAGSGSNKKENKKAIEKLANLPSKSK